MLYYAIEKLKSIKFSQSSEWLLTLLYLVVAVVLVVQTINPTWMPYSWGEVFFVVTIISVILGCMVKYLMDYYVIKKDN